MEKAWVAVKQGMEAAVRGAGSVANAMMGGVERASTAAEVCPDGAVGERSQEGGILGDRAGVRVNRLHDT